MNGIEDFLDRSVFALLLLYKTQKLFSPLHGYYTVKVYMKAGEVC